MPPGDILFHLLLGLATVMTVAALLGAVCRWLGQPPVIGQIAAGIVLGPSLLGRCWPEAQAYIMPAEVVPFLAIVAQLGIILDMFVVGLELNAGMVLTMRRATLGIAGAGLALPFVLGGLLAFTLHGRYAPAGVSTGAFALFLGVSMAVTAFPVLARILADRGLTRTNLGGLALACAAVADLLAWCLLAVVVGVMQSRLNGAALTIGLSVVYLLAMVLVIRPLAEGWLARWKDPNRPTQSDLAIVFVAVLVSALTTEAIGIHALFGAFLLGAIIPHDSTLANVLIRRIDDMISVLFLPAFFALAGLRTEIGLVDDVGSWLVCGLIVVVAVVGKLLGTGVAARACGRSWREASALGVLMNTRGLMELIVLNVGLDLGVISPTLYTMLVIMALVTTMMTGPLLSLLDAWFAPSRSMPNTSEPAVAGVTP